MSISGRMVGDVDVANLHIGSTGTVYGDISCRTILVDHGASMVGNIQIKNDDLESELVSSEEVKSTALETNVPVMEPTIIVSDEVIADVTCPIIAEKTFKVVMLILEPQMDFYKDSAEQDSAERLASFIDSNGSDIDDIVVALDSHHVSFFHYSK